MAALGLGRAPRLGAGLGRLPVAPGVPGVALVVPGVPGVAPVAPARAMAGHNRWSKVRNVKGPRDAERSRLFQRMAQLLRAAAREGGPDPALNPALAAVVQRCRTHNVPKATIEGALRPDTAAPAGGPQLLLGARGPGGARLLLDVRSDGARRCPAELRTLLARHGAALAEGVQHEFEAVGVVRVSGRALTMEHALEVAAVAGAQDVVAEDEEDEEAAEVKFLCAPPSLRSVRQLLEAAGLRPLSAAVEFRPRSPLAPAQPAAERLLRALAECPAVLRLFHNVQPWPESPGGQRPEGTSGQPPPATGPAGTEGQ